MAKLDTVLPSESMAPNAIGPMSSSGARWKTPPPTAADDKEGGRSSVSDVFADMLGVNEDMIVAAAECQADGDVEGLIAYQRLLHRDLMEMAEFIDSMFGVYSNSSSTTSVNAATSSSEKTSDVASDVVDLTTEPMGGEAPSSAVVKADEAQEKPAEKSQRGVLRTAIEAGEKVHMIQRSKEHWIKSRHQVQEEEGVSAIMNDSPSGIINAPGDAVDANAAPEGSGGLALANQLRAQQHIAAYMNASNAVAAAAAAGASPPVTAMNLLLASQLGLSAPTAQVTSLPVTVAAAPPPLPAIISSVAEQQIKPNTTGSNPPKIALPPAHSMFNVNMFFPFPGAPPLMFNPQAPGGVVSMPPWPQLQTTLPARTVVPARSPAKSPEFKRMCESCRKRHFSVRQCRLVLQHKDPEWQPAQPPPASRRRRRKQPATNSTQGQVT